MKMSFGLKIGLLFLERAKGGAEKERDSAGFKENGDMNLYVVRDICS